MKSIARLFSTLLGRATGKSDYRRWGTTKALSGKWDSRTIQIARLVPEAASVIEFGAGRLVMKDHLPTGCTYTPSDLVDRGDGTIVCDLNDATLPTLQPYDVAAFSGVLEYVNDVPRLIAHLSGCVNIVLASYAVTDANKGNRRAQGWVNDYSADELIEVFAKAGFCCGHTEQWKSQIIFKFSKE